MQEQSQFFDLYRSMAQRANESFRASLESAERLHHQQIEAGRVALERSNELWKGLWRAAGDAQIMMWSQLQSQYGQTTEMMRQAYDLTRRATEDATRMAASQVTTITRDAQNAAQNEQRAAHQERAAQHRKSA